MKTFWNKTIDNHPILILMIGVMIIITLGGIALEALPPIESETGEMIEIGWEGIIPMLPIWMCIIAMKIDKKIRRGLLVIKKEESK